MLASSAFVVIRVPDVAARAWIMRRIVDGHPVYYVPVSVIVFEIVAGAFDEDIGRIERLSQRLYDRSEFEFVLVVFYVLLFFYTL